MTDARWDLQDQEVNTARRIIVALDFDTDDDAEATVDAWATPVSHTRWAWSC